MFNLRKTLPSLPCHITQERGLVSCAVERLKPTHIRAKKMLLDSTFLLRLWRATQSLNLLLPACHRGTERSEEGKAFLNTIQNNETIERSLPSDIRENKSIPLIIPVSYPINKLAFFVPLQHPAQDAVRLTSFLDGLVRRCVAVMRLNNRNDTSHQSSKTSDSTYCSNSLQKEFQSVSPNL